MKKGLFAAIIILLLSMSPIVDVTEAVSITHNNPNPPQGTIPPKITLLSPQDNQTYSSNVINLTLSITKPMLDNWSSGLSLIVYCLDGKSSTLYTGNPTNSFYYCQGLPDYNTSFYLPSLQAGNHTLWIDALGEVWNTPTSATSDIVSFQSESMATLHFTTLTQQPTPTPSPTPITPGAEWFEGDTYCTIELPHNTTYTTQNIRLMLATGCRDFYTTGSYSVDGGPEIFINAGVYGYSAIFKTTAHLTDGNHTIRLKVYSCWSDFRGFTTVHLTVNHSLPFITLESPKNQTYHNQTIDLNYTLIDKENSEAKYSLDNKENVTVSNKLSLPELENLTDGTHQVVVYADDDFGNVYSTQTSFEVRTTPSVTVAGISVIMLLGAIVAPIVVAVALLIFFKRRKSKTVNVQKP